MWRFVKTGMEGRCELFGVNIFNYKWRSTGQSACVADPSYNQNYELSVYEADIDGKVVTFAAGEFSNCVYGFYINE